MYQLYYYPLNASLAPHFVLEALGVNFELVLVDRKTESQKSQSYLALNPAGRIPVLVDNGQAIFESAAICIHLAEQHPDKQLIPEIGDKSRADFMQWLMYLTNTLQAELMIYFYPQNHCSTELAKNAVLKAQQARLKDMLLLLDRHLTDKDFLIGNKISACDYFLFMLAVWADEIDAPPLSFPQLNRYLKQLAQRAEIQRVCATEGISLLDYR